MDALASIGISMSHGVIKKTGEGEGERERERERE